MRPAINVGLSGASDGRGYGFISQRAGLWVRKKCPRLGSPLRRDHRHCVLTARAYPAHWSMQGIRDDRYPKSCDAPKARTFWHSSNTMSDVIHRNPDTHANDTPTPKEAGRALTTRDRTSVTGIAGEALKGLGRQELIISYIFPVNDNVPAHDENTTGNKRQVEKSSKLFETAVSVAGLTKAWMAIKSHPGMMTPGVSPETLNKIDEKWFVTTSSLLLQGNFRYPHRRRIHMPKPAGKTGTRPLTVGEARVKIIERALLDAIEPRFEGAWQWTEIDAQEYARSKKDKSIPSNDLKRNKSGHFIKEWTLPAGFSPNSHGFRPNKSTHTALRAIKEWRTDTAWLIDYGVKKAFDNVNRGRLRRIFLNHVDEPRLWKEIEKMMNAGIVDPSFISEVKGVPPFALPFASAKAKEGSVLSPFLFNVYMNEFDKFVKELSDEIAKKGLRDPSAKRAYQNLVDEFSSRRVATALKRYGSVEGVRAAARQKKKEYYDKYGASQGASKDRFLRYVRYADDFLIGVGGPRELVTEIQRRIDLFLKSDLHLEVKENRMLSRSDGGAKFLGFRVHLSDRKKKTRVKWNRFASIGKYKRRVLERFKQSDRRAARAFVEGARRDLIRAYQERLEGARLNRTSIKEASTALIDAPLGMPRDYTGENPAMQRWIESFDNRFKFEMVLAHKFYRKQAQIIPIDQGDPGAEKLIRIRDEFLRKLDSLIEEERFSYFKDRRETVLLHWETESLKKKREGSQLNAWEEMSEQTAIKLADALTEAKLEHEKVRKIGVVAPTRDLVDKLVEKNFYHYKRRRPIAKASLTSLNDAEIIACYTSVICGLMNYYRPADNFNEVKGLLEGLRRSCALTLSMKHKKSLAWVYQRYTEDISTDTVDGRKVALPAITLVAQAATKWPEQAPQASI
jgi:hypothetical protein